jgi:hypothetical protein
MRKRQYVKQREDDVNLLLHSAVCDLYAPALFWTSALSETAVAETFAELYLHPKSPLIHTLLRLAVLLGSDFCDWLYPRWHSKWKRHPQPPSFYFTFKKMKSNAGSTDPRLAASRLRSNAQLQIDERSVRVDDLIENPQEAESLLSTACMRVFENNDSEVRATARYLDLFAYGPQVQNRKAVIGRGIRKAIGDQEAGDPVGTATEE